MNVALCVGVDYYASERVNNLEQCVLDANDMANALRVNGDGSPNFETITCFARDEKSAISKDKLSALLRHLFSLEVETALFYFSGHGAVTDYAGYLCTSEIERPEHGLSMEELMMIVRESRAHNRVIILDSCHSGTLGEVEMSGYCKLPPNTTILAACNDDAVAYEGVFTPLVVDALNGGAMNLVGEVTPGSVYAHVDRALGIFYQRPVFKANVKNFVCLKKNKAPIALEKLHLLPALFPEPEMEFPLDPTYEEDKNNTDNKEVNKAHEKVFALLRSYAALNLVVPVGEEYMYWAAVRSKSCKLTALGQYYWGLVVKGRI